MLKKKCIRPSNHHSPPLCRFLSTTSSLPFSHTQNLVSFALVPFPFALPFSNTSLFKFKICSNVQMQLSGTELVEWGRDAAQTVHGFSQVTALSAHCLGLLLGPCTCQESGVTVQANSNLPPPPISLVLHPCASSGSGSVKWTWSTVTLWPWHQTSFSKCHVPCFAAGLDGAFQQLSLSHYHIQEKEMSSQGTV